jgi:hypothetical protein
MYGVALAATRLGHCTGTVFGCLEAIIFILSFKALNALLNASVCLSLLI